MFNPNSYRDTDFGLASGESFEPGDADHALSVNTAEPHVMTVLGPVDPDDLGICLTHHHLLGNRLSLPGRDGHDRFDDLERAAEELESFALMGGRSIVDATTADVGRNAAAIHGLAQRLPLHIIATTGITDLSRNSPKVAGMDRETIGEEFLKDLRIGMEGTSARAGIITVGGSTAGFTEGDDTTLRAAALAHRATGAPVAAHVGGAIDAHDMLDRMERQGVAPDRIILRHLDQGQSMDSLKSLAGRGAVCSFDQVGNADLEGDVAQARSIVELFEAGFGDSLLISQDLETKSASRSSGGSPELIYLLERFTLTLMEAGAEAGMVRRLLIENPGRAFRIVPLSADQDFDTSSGHPGDSVALS